MTKIIMLCVFVIGQIVFCTSAYAADTVRVVHCPPNQTGLLTNTPILGNTRICPQHRDVVCAGFIETKCLSQYDCKRTIKWQTATNHCAACIRGAYVYYKGKCKS